MVKCSCGQNTVICRLETYFGNIVDWKHQNRLETKFLDWKHVYEIRNKTKYIGNNEFSLETKFVGWKQWNEIENTNSRLETYYAGVYFLAQKSVWRSSLSRDELASKMRSWSRFLFRILTKIADSNYWKVDQNHILTRDHQFRIKKEFNCL